MLAALTGSALALILGLNLAAGPRLLGDDPRAPLRTRAGEAFAGEQGANGWSYLGSEEPLRYDAERRLWIGDEPFASLGAQTAHPGPTEAVIRRFTTPLAGTARLRGDVVRASRGGDGTAFAVRVAGRTLWSALVLEAESFDLEVEVGANAAIEFVVWRGPRDNTYDAVRCDPEVVIDPAAPPVASARRRLRTRSSLAFGPPGDSQGWSYWSSAGPLRYVPARDRWEGADEFAFLTHWGGHPGRDESVTRRFTAPFAGTVRMRMFVCRSDPRGDGVVLEVRRDGVWCARWAIEDSNERVLRIDLEVEAGSSIDVVLARGPATHLYDATQLDIDLVAEGR